MRPTRPGWAAALIVACAVASCASPPAPTATDPDLGTGGERYSCGDDLTFTTDALNAPVGAENADHPTAAALRSLLTVERSAGFLPDSGYRRVAQTNDVVLFLARPPGRPTGRR